MNFNIPVYALPINDSYYKGCYKLIYQEKARLIYDYEQLLNINLGN